MRIRMKYRFLLLILLALTPPLLAAGQQDGLATASPSARPEWYGPVREGEDLGHIAEKLPRPPDITLEQVMVALYRANPTAFVAADMHSLRSGARLRVPSAQQVAAIPRDEAMAWVHDRHVLLAGGSSSEQLETQLKQVEQLSATLHAERDSLRQRVATMESQVEALSQQLSLAPALKSQEAPVHGRGADGHGRDQILLGSFAVLALAAGLGFWLYRRFAARITR